MEAAQAMTKSRFHRLIVTETDAEAQGKADWRNFYDRYRARYGTGLASTASPWAARVTMNLRPET